MPYQLNRDLSYCTIDGHPIFLDLQKDQYFRLSNAMERAFLAYLEGDLCPERDLQRLVTHNILVNASSNACHVVASVNQRPNRSAIEQAPNLAQVRISTSLDVFRVVFATWLQLKRSTLKQTLDALAAYRQRHTSELRTVSPEALEGRLFDAAAAFRRARLYVPIETCCLPDSISMVKFLAKQGFYTNLVFGVMGEPLSAHCWVQAQTLVLNDTVGNANAYTQIRVV